MTGRVLEVFCFEQRAGTLTDAAGGLAFEYWPAWLEAGQPPLSQSLPVEGHVSSAAVAAFFGGLLPEGQPRRLLERQLGVGEGNVFRMLGALGGDTAGAISVFEPGADRAAGRARDEVDWLDDAGVATLVDELPIRPMHADADGEWRLSLAGAQDKLPVVVDRGGRIGLTRGRTPSTHILKTPIDRFDGTVANEAFCLALARALGLGAANATPRRIEGRELLLVERYDRAADADGRLRRLHQEDFCQALGVPPERKYESDGGPGLGDSFALLRRAASVPATSLLALLDLVGLNFIVGNHDAHGKNVSLLYTPWSAAASLAPGYDLLSTAAYASSHRMSRKMAMRIGGEYRPEYVKARHIDRMLGEAGLAVRAGRRRLHRLALAAPEAAATLRTQFAADGWDSEVLAEIESIIGQCAEQLAEITSA